MRDRASSPTTLIHALLATLLAVGGLLVSAPAFHPAWAQETLPAEAVDTEPPVAGDPVEPPAVPSAPTGPTGIAALVDDRAVLDRVEVQVSGLAPPPEGSAYRVWLLSDDQTALVLVGDLGFIGPEDGIVAWSQPAGEPLFIEFSEALITLESGPAGQTPVGEPVLRGQVDAGALTFFRRLMVRWPDSRYGTGSMQGLRQLSSAVHFHAAVLREAAVAGDLETAWRKAEHVVNIIEGQAGGVFGDHDGNGRAEDPGDGVGLLTYGSGALTHTQFAWATAFDEGVAEAALALQTPVHVGLEWAGLARQLALEVAATSAAEDAVELAALLFAATEQLVVAVDPRWNEALAAQAGLEERVPAYESALALLQLQLLPGGTTATANAAQGGS